MIDSSAALTRRAVLRGLAAGGALGVSVTLLGCSTNKPESGKHKHSKDSAPSTGALSAASGTLVMIIRHGEEPDTSTLPGIDASGNPDDHSLTQVGWNRARALVDLFDPPNGQPRPGLARPTLIYAAGVTEGGSGTRSRETVTPLAQKLGIQVNTTFGKGDEQAMAAQITSQPGPTLIAWQHSEIPTIAAAFGSLTPAPPTKWDGTRYDVIWTLTANSTGWNFTPLPEMVLPQDQPQTIAG